MNILELYNNVLSIMIQRDIIVPEGGVLWKFEDMIKKSEILKKHTYTIWQGTGKDKRWKTRLSPTQTVAKPTEEELFIFLAKYYAGEDEKAITLKDLYPEWLEHKALHTTSTGYLGRIDCDWRKYYDGTPITSRPLRSLTKLELDEWAHRIIKDNSLTRKQYYNMAIIMRQSLDYAVDKKILGENPFLKVNIEAKLFRVTPRPEAKTQVLTNEELSKLKKVAYEEFDKTNETSALGVLLIVFTGVRAGEAVAFKESDVICNNIRVERQEVRTMSQGPDGKFNTVGYEVVPHTKSDAGLRDVYLPKEARDIILKIRLHNQKLGIDNPEGWLFFNTKNEKMHERSLARKMEKLCALAAISPKSLHKLRKTYISRMLDSGVSDDKVRETVGHNSLKVTYSNYYFDSKTKDETEAEFESVWSKVV